MSGLPVECPACSTRYLLPTSLLGEAGANVRCPSCGHEFTVDATGTVIGASSPIRNIARMVFDELVARVGTGLADSARDGRLFADHGPDVLEAWDEFRRRAGAQAPSRPFREELRARFGVDLLPPGGGD